MLSKWGLISLVLAFGLFVLPYLTVIIYNTPFETEIDPAYLTGLITASGILFAFIGTAALTKANSLEYDIMLLVTLDFLFFSYASIQVFFGALEGKPTVFILSWVAGSLLSNAGTVLVLMKRLRLQEL